MEDDREGEHRNYTLSSSQAQDSQVDGSINKLISQQQNTMAEERLAAGHRGRSIGRKRTMKGLKKAAVLSILATVPTAMAETCISISGSKICPAFSDALVTTSNITVVKLFPFLQFVSNTATFDKQLAAYASTSYVQLKYQQLLGCGNVDLSNTTDLYARFTNTVICNAIVQNSKDTCSLSETQAKPVCANTCGDQAQSEANIVANPQLCSNPFNDTLTQIRADLTNCALPPKSISKNCISGADNEPENCGYGNSTLGLCTFCASGGANNTETCCYNSKAETRCKDVVLPSITAPTVVETSTVTTTASATAAPRKAGLSGGAIAGIAIGAVVGAALLIGLIVLLVMCLRRKRGSQAGSVFNQPSPPRKSQGMAYNPVGAQAPAGFEVLPGGRIARMSALEGHSGNSPPRGAIEGGAAAGAAAYAAGRGRRHHEVSSSDEFRESPESDIRAGVLRPPPTSRRHGSLSSNSALGDADPHSPHSGSGGDMSSPQGVASQQSEQLPYFKDYYSQDEIHPGDKVATLWAYQPRAGDEFLLERGDMLKVVGIWDDGWATGVMIDERADEWDAKRNAQRDSGVSNGSGRRESSPQTSGEIKAFPLVCVCLPEHWKKTIEGDGSTETGSSGQQGPPVTS